MLKSLTKQSNTEFAPLRSLDDFLLESARFQIPNFRDLDKWGNRVSNNLLYYQSNYFLMSLLLFMIVGVLHPVKLTMGFFIMAFILMIFKCSSNETYSLHQFKEKHPLASVCIALTGAYLVYYSFASILVFLAGILVPLSAIFIHASLRLRNIRNKIVNRMENLEVKQTPMGFFLKEIGFQSEMQ